MFDLAGPESINLGLGEPDLNPPVAAIEGMYKATVEGLNRYGPTAGIPELRTSVAECYGKYGKMGSENIIITPSGSTALLEIMTSYLNPGDNVLIPSPGFVIYGPHSKLAGADYTEYKLTEGDFQPDVEDIANKITKNTRMIVVNSPSNPTGGVLSEESYKALIDLAEDKGLYILSDEVYDPYVYEGVHRSFMDRLDLAFVVNGFSKTMAVTGWRLGFICASEEHIEDLIKMQYHVCASPAMPPQYGVLAALPEIDSYLENARNVFKTRRDLISSRIDEIDGLSLIPPRGAFYAFPSFDMDISSQELANILVKNGLICTPGSAFGEFGEGHLRFSYAADEKKISAGMDILESTVRKLRK